ncbi:preprotein translocase subunit SecE [Thorsellia anophelis]|uniref:Protein translocase subunit SecE n=1 Tax=Thorsellia anophelis DSM 18579 TaxID=1123402 RepID=A0A1I0E236_9GAMM|nr:preprotein translocase subunit SecE [Thorsellia anophelis]SET38234.1 protein translocase subunit secE/sec61 gamma [Thorsellia anophelis DSM 18579]
MSANAKKIENKEIKDNNPSKGSDAFKWSAVFALVAAAIVGNVYFDSYEFPIVRIIAVIIVMALAIGLALITVKGKSFINLAREARIELKKVVWPTRQEATQTTLIVAAITILIALILWGLDGILIRIVTWITKFGVGA